MAKSGGICKAACTLVPSGGYRRAFPLARTKSLSRPLKEPTSVWSGATSLSNDAPRDPRRGSVGNRARDRTRRAPFRNAVDSRCGSACRTPPRASEPLSTRGAASRERSRRRRRCGRVYPRPISRWWRRPLPGYGRRSRWSATRVKPCRSYGPARDSSRQPRSSLIRSSPKHWGRAHHARALSGPSFALEVAQGLPTAVTLAAVDPAFAQEIARELHQPRSPRLLLG